MQRRTEKIIKEIALKYNLSEEVVKAVVEAQFKCARDVIGSAEAGNPDTFTNVRFKHIGTLLTSAAKIKYIEDARRNRDNKNSKDGGN
jgi:hypothetical protein